jgi:hypothetical protein
VSLLNIGAGYTLFYGKKLIAYKSVVPDVGDFYFEPVGALA